MEIFNRSRPWGRKLTSTTEFLICHAVKQENIIQIDATKPWLVSSKNYSNGRGGLWKKEDYIKYIKKIEDFIENYYKITHKHPNFSSEYNKIALPLAIVRIKEDVTRGLYLEKNQKIRIAVEKRILPETFEYQWYINENFHVFVLMPDGRIDEDMTKELVNVIDEKIKTNTKIAEISGYEKSEFAEDLSIQKEIRDIIRPAPQKKEEKTITV